jgi:hypothetical protein
VKSRRDETDALVPGAWLCGDFNRGSKASPRDVRDPHRAAHELCRVVLSANYTKQSSATHCEAAAPLEMADARAAPAAVFRPVKGIQS